MFLLMFRNIVCPPSPHPKMSDCGCPPSVPQQLVNSWHEVVHKRLVTFRLDFQ